MSRSVKTPQGSVTLTITGGPCDAPFSELRVFSGPETGGAPKPSPTQTFLFAPLGAFAFQERTGTTSKGYHALPCVCPWVV